ncbi:MAG: SDR family NAD(P)-dependent oxidoreductase, partial [Yaniella sp.]|nr:SDR family NAD(P)-dependent oxidoreductase [Yaniella sp.]
MTKFENKTFIITGGGSGLGKATCHRLAADGAQIGVLDLKLESAEAVANEINEGHSSKSAIALEADVTNAEAVESAVAKTVKEFGTL